MSRKALGRGLSALFTQTISSELLELDVDLLRPTEAQPRRSFKEERLNELAQSIKANGIIQPIVARKDGDWYQIIAGERRWRAAQIAGIRKIPCLVREVAEKDTLEISLIENVQREDLNPIEEALAYRGLLDKLALTQEEVARRVGKDRSSITNVLRLLKLPPDIQRLVEDGSLSMGHARALLSLDSAEQQLRLSKEVIAGDLNVRQTETLVKQRMASAKETARPQAKAADKKDPNVVAAEQKLSKGLGAPARIKFLKEGGVLEIKFSSNEDLSRLFDLLIQRTQRLSN